MRRLAIALATLALVGCQCEDTFGHLDAAVELSPESLDFEKVPVTTRSEETVVLHNRGSFTLTASAFEAAPPFFGPTEDLTIGPGASAEIVVAFAPTEVGAATGALLFATNDPDAPTVEIPLTGEGIPAAVALDPAVVDFGEVLWETNTARQFVNVTVSNPGSDPFDVETVTLAEDGAGAFGLDPRDSVKAYAPDDSGRFEISFLPVALGPTSGRVVLTTTAPSVPEVEVALRALAVGPDMVVCAVPPGGVETCTPATLTLPFGPVEKDTTATGELRIQNAGSRDLRLSNLRLTSQTTDFSLDPELAAGGEIIAPSETRTVSVHYTPTNFGQDTGVVTVLGNSAVRPVASAGLSGRAARPDLRAVPEGVSKSFQTPSVDTTVDVALYNCGDDPLVLGDVSIEYDTEANQLPPETVTLVQAPAAGTTLPPAGPDCTTTGTPEVITIRFQTEDNGIRSGNILVPSNDPVDPVLPVSFVFQKTGG